MPNISVLKTSKFLKKEDVGPGSLLTISKCTEENVGKEGAPEELKWCLHFEESDKPMVLNSTNGQIIAGFIGSDNTDDWTGRKIVLYSDPNITFGGKLIGGIRARAPRNKPANVPATAMPAAPPAPPTPAAPPWPTNPAAPSGLPTEADDITF